MRFIRTNHNMRIFGVIPFIKLQNDTQTTGEQYDVELRRLYAFDRAVLFLCPVLGKNVT